MPGFEYRDRQPGRSDAEKQRLFWKEHNEAVSQKNAARGKEALEKNGPIPRLGDVYAASTREVQERTAKQLQEVEASPYAIKVPLSMLPPNDPLVIAEKKRYFGIVDEQTKIEQLEARIKELEQNNG